MNLPAVVTQLLLLLLADLYNSCVTLAVNVDRHDVSFDRTFHCAGRFLFGEDHG